MLLVGPQLPGSEAGAVQGRPEPVARPCEVPARRCRVQARVDAGEQHPQPRRDHVGNGPPARRCQFSGIRA